MRKFRGLRVGPARELTARERTTFKRQPVFGQVVRADDQDPKAPRTTFIASTERVARDDWIVRVAGWELDNYLRNPVFADSHNYDLLPLGQAVDVRKVLEGDARGFDLPRLEIDIDWATARENPKAPHVQACYASGLMRAVSVGFIPQEFAELTDEQRSELGLRPWGEEVTRADLLELSAVLVPSDAGAVAITESVENGVRRGILTRGTLDWLKRTAAIARKRATGRAPSSVRGQRATFLSDVVGELERALEVVSMGSKRGTRGGRGNRRGLMDDGSAFVADLRPPAWFDPDTLDESIWPGHEPAVRVVHGVVKVGTELTGDDLEGQRVVQSVHFDKDLGWSEDDASAWVQANREDMAGWRGPSTESATDDDAEDDDGDQLGDGEGAPAGEGEGEGAPAGEPAAALTAGRGLEEISGEVTQVLRAIASAATDAADLIEGQAGDSEPEGEGEDPAAGEGSENAPGASMASVQATTARLLARALSNVTGSGLRTVVREVLKAELDPILGELADEVHELRAAVHQGGASGSGAAGRGAHGRSPRSEGGSARGASAALESALGDLRRKVAKPGS